MSLDELPGAELILPGLDDLYRGQPNTVGALLGAIAATRLTEARLNGNYSALKDGEDFLWNSFRALRFISV